MTYKGDDRRSKHWHLSRSVNVTIILSVIVLMFTQAYTYGKQSEKLEAIERTVMESTDLDQRLIVQEYKIEVVSDDIKGINQTLKENQQLIIELLQRTKQRN